MDRRVSGPGEEGIDVAGIVRQMRALLAGIEHDYDFASFTIESFKAWVEECTGRAIEFVPLSLESVSGGWMRSEADSGPDYVFFLAGVSGVLSSHCQLHELAHVLCGHQGVPISDLLASGHAGGDALRLRAVYSKREEVEAEILGSLIQERVLSHDRLDELLSVASSSEETVAYFKALGID